MNHNHEIKPSQINYQESYLKLVESRTLFFNEVFTDESCTQLGAMLMYLDSLKEDLITIYITSPGGATTGLLHVYDVMNMIKSPVRTVCLGFAASAGAVLLSSGKKGERYATKTSEIMIHGIGFVFPRPGMQVEESENLLKFLKTHNNDLMKILSKNTGKSLEEIKIDCLVDTYMTAAEAKKYGLIDHII